MKKKIGIMLCITLIGLLIGCGGSSGNTARTDNQPQGVNDVLEAGIAEADESTAGSAGASDAAGTSDNAGTPDDTGTPDAAGARKTAGAVPDNLQGGDYPDVLAPEEVTDPDNLLGTTEGVDLDLTKLSSTMVYLEVYNMINTPENYMGKIVKMEGNFGVYHDEAADVNYYACVIQDATACCAQGIEFELAGDYKWPDDYPEQGEVIAVTGVFDTYEEDGNTYCTLREARLV